MFPRDAFVRAWIRKWIPDLFRVDSVLYVGASQLRQDYLDDFCEGCQDVVVLEAFKENADWLEERGYRVVHGDVRDYEPTQQFDVVFWWHGPEHVTERDMIEVLKKIPDWAAKCVVVGFPWGTAPQGEVYGNEFEIHRQLDVSIDIVRELGYEVACFGLRGQYPANVIAAKILAGPHKA